MQGPRRSETRTPAFSPVPAGDVAQELTQTPPFYELHRDEDLTFGFLHRVEVHDVGMIQGSRGSGLLLQPRKTID